MSLSSYTKIVKKFAEIKNIENAAAAEIILTVIAEFEEKAKKFGSLESRK
jgi:hypothetical protein